MSREAMKQALEALESDPLTHAGLVNTKQAITALRQALEQPADEPVAWGMPRSDGVIMDCISPEEHANLEGDYTIPLYTRPQPAAQWVGLTDEEIDELEDDRSLETTHDFICAIEAKLKEKNT